MTQEECGECASRLILTYSAARKLARSVGVIASMSSRIARQVLDGASGGFRSSASSLKRGSGKGSEVGVDGSNAEPGPAGHPKEITCLAAAGILVANRCRRDLP